MNKQQLIKTSSDAPLGVRGKEEFTLTVYTENQIGLLNRIGFGR